MVLPTLRKWHTITRRVRFITTANQIRFNRIASLKTTICIVQTDGDGFGDLAANDRSQANEFSADEKTDPLGPTGPDRDSDDLPILYLLEVVASTTPEFEVSITSDLFLGDSTNLTSNGFKSSAELGTIGPRGPPVI